MPQAPRGHGGALLGASAREIVFPGIESEALLLLLDQAGICASTGSACLAASDEPSRVVRAMKPESAASRQMVRFSLGKETSMAKIAAAVAAVSATFSRLSRS